VIHEDCPRRPHFDAGRFAQGYGDAGHRAGHCLYKLGCKGPQTHANCALLPFCEVPGAWPVGIGHPCVGCSEQGVGFAVPLHENLPIAKPTAPMAYPGTAEPQGSASAVAAGVAGLAVGAIAGAGFVASKKLARDEAE
jgi:hydrogenase small subunit